MKLIIRTLIILAAASLVVGIAYGISSTEWGSSLLGGARSGEEHDRPESFASPEGFEGGEFDPSAMADMPERGDRPDFEGGRPGGGFSLAETLKNLAVVGAITTVVVGVSWLAGRVKKLRKRRTTSEAVA
jgi:hypothetical protein